MMNFKKIGPCLLFLLGLSFSVHAVEIGGTEENPFTVWFDGDPVTVQPGQTYPYRVIFQIPEGYYLYDEAMQVTLNGDTPVQVAPLQKSSTELKEDPFSGRTVPVFYNEATIELPIKLPVNHWAGELSLAGDIQFQGCSKELCYKVMHVPFKARFVLDHQLSSVDVSKKPHDSSIGTSLARPDFLDLEKNGSGWMAFLIAFLGGILTAFTPCVWPMIPITLSVVGVRKNHSPGQNFRVTLVLVAGMGVMYSLLGMSAAFLGKSLGFFFQSTVFLLLLETLLILMGLSMLGLFEIQLPPKLQSKISQIHSSGWKGTFLIGLTMGLLAAPCVGPVVGPILLYVAKSKNVLMGFSLLFVYAMGMGMLFLLLAALYGVVHFRLKSGPWMEWVKKGLGVALLVVAVYYGQSLFAQIKGDSTVTNTEWMRSLPPALERATREHKPLLVDFFAQWCPPCKELDLKVWSRPKIRQELAEKFVAVKIDCTTETPECTEAVARFHVIGWPTVVFVNSAGEEVSGERLVGKVIDEAAMQEKLDQIK